MIRIEGLYHGHFYTISINISVLTQNTLLFHSFSPSMIGVPRNISCGIKNITINIKGKHRRKVILWHIIHWVSMQGIHASNKERWWSKVNWRLTCLRHQLCSQTQPAIGPHDRQRRNMTMRYFTRLFFPIQWTMSSTPMINEQQCHEKLSWFEEWNDHTFWPGHNQRSAHDDLLPRRIVEAKKGRDRSSIWIDELKQTRNIEPSCERQTDDKKEERKGQ
jgi:hypothetical protein